MQPPDFRLLTHADWLPMLGEMPLPCYPVPGNSVFSGTSIRENQYAAG